MRQFSMLSMVPLAMALPALFAQEPATAPAAKPSAFSSVLGEVTNVDTGAKQVTIKTDAGVSSTVSFRR